MPIHPEMDKQKMLELNRVEHDFLRRTVALLSPEQQVSAEIVPGWTAKDIMAHVSTWERRVIGWIEAAEQGEPVDRPSTGYPDAVVNPINAADHAVTKDLPLEEVKAVFERSFFEYQRMLASLSDEALFTPGYFAFTGKRPLWGFVAADGYEHYIEHSEDIRKWLAAQEG